MAVRIMHGWQSINDIVVPRLGRRSGICTTPPSQSREPEAKKLDAFRNCICTLNRGLPGEGVNWPDVTQRRVPGLDLERPPHDRLGTKREMQRLSAYLEVSAHRRNFTPRCHCCTRMLQSPVPTEHPILAYHIFSTCAENPPLLRENAILHDRRTGSQPAHLEVPGKK